MPIIASHHRNDTWRPQLAWPDDCTVQWGGRGVVLSREGSYRTAFFEAFPQDGSGGFIRGEGETLEAAEVSAYARWKRQMQCFSGGGHRWSRNRRFKNGQTRLYINGGAFCLRCGAFETVLPPIVELGDWRKPLCVSELSLIRSGAIWPRDAKPDTVKFARKLWLRARAAGIRLPHYSEPPFNGGIPRDWDAIDRYGEACSIEVLRLYAHAVQAGTMLGASGGIAGLFDAMALRELHDAAVEAGFLPEGTPAPA